MKSSGELLEPAHAHPANRRGLLAQRVCAPRSRKTTFGADRQAEEEEEVKQLKSDRRLL